MHHYRFSTLFVLTCTGLLLVLGGCDQHSGMQDPTNAEKTPTDVTPTKQEQKINAALDAMAQDVAAALNNKQVRLLIKRETGTMLAGQHNVLFETIATKKTWGMAKGRRPVPFQRVLARQRAATATAKSDRRLSVETALNEVQADAKAIPKFDIGVPVRHEAWDPGKQTPLVAFHHRQEIDDTKLERVKAYDADGNVHWLDAREAPEQPVVVLGVNERTTADGEIQPAYRSGAESKALPCCGGGGGGHGGGGSSSEDPREYGDKEYLDRVKVTDDSEPWPKGDPELKIDIRSQQDSGLHMHSLDKRDGSTANPFNGDDTSWNFYNEYLFRWTKSKGEDYTLWHVYEVDGEASVDFSITYQGQEYGVSVGWSDDNDYIGYHAMDFEVYGETFSVGGVKWETYQN